MLDDRSHPTPAALTPGQRDLLQHKIHVAPRALTQSDANVRRRLSSAWSAALRLVAALHGIPEDALHWWARQPRGHILLTAEDEGYSASLRASGDRALAATALVPLHRILAQPDHALKLTLQPLDHLLGCDADPTGAWLSDGGGRTPRWQRVGGHIATLFPLGYGLSDAGINDPHWYWAEGLATALRDRRKLNAADPKLERLLGQSILDDGFWRNFVAEESQDLHNDRK
ncbi:MAG: hypothetical protein R2873_11445 [Caldilineaceae bacterium]